MEEILTHHELEEACAECSNFAEDIDTDVIERQEFEHSVTSAIEIYEQRKTLVDNVLKHIGTEHYMQIVNLLEQKCFGHLNAEDAAHHIMHRVLNGTIISPKESTDDKFIYDKHDKTLYVILSYLEDVDDVETAIQIINGISVDY